MVGTEIQKGMSIFTLMMLNGLIETVAAHARKEGVEVRLQANLSS